MNNTGIRKNDDENWKRMSLKGNKVWAAVDGEGKLIETKGKVKIKYNLKQNYEYQAGKENLKPEADAVPGKNKSKHRSSRKPSGRRTDFHSAGKIKNGGGMEIPDNAIIIYTDGASSGNPGPSGIGILLKYGNHEKEISEFIGNSTNNIAELKAIERALSEIKRHDLPVRLFTDSGYSLGLLTKGWKPKKNVEIVENIKRLIHKFNDLKFIKVKGHAGIQGNETADRLATSAVHNKKTG